MLSWVPRAAVTMMVTVGIVPDGFYLHFAGASASAPAVHDSIRELIKWVKDNSKSVLEPAIEAHVAQQQQSRKAGRVAHGSSSHD